MTLIPCGTDATIKLTGIKAIITAIEIRFELITYQLSYFNNGEMHTVWLNDKLFEPGKHEEQKIGFSSK